MILSRRGLFGAIAGAPLGVAAITQVPKINGAGLSAHELTTLLFKSNRAFVESARLQLGETILSNYQTALVGDSFILNKPCVKAGALLPG